MPRMTVGMVASTRKKARFPTVGTDITAKAKPPSSATAFCINSITLIGAIKVEKHMIEPTQSAATKSRRSPARHREKWKGKYHRLAPPSHYITRRPTTPNLTAPYPIAIFIKQRAHQPLVDGLFLCLTVCVSITLEREFDCGKLSISATYSLCP